MRRGRWGEIRVSLLMALAVIFLLIPFGCACVLVEYLWNGKATSSFIFVNVCIITACIAIAFMAILFTRKRWIIPSKYEETPRSAAAAGILGLCIALGGLLILVATAVSGQRGMHWGLFALIGGIGMASSGKWGKFTKD